MRFNAGIKVGLVIAGMAFASTAQAVPLDGTPLTILAGGVSATFTVTNCSNTGGSCLDFNMVQDGSSLGVTIQPTSGPALASYSLGNDVTFDLNLVSASQPITGIFDSIIGLGAGSSAGLGLPGQSLTAYPSQSATLVLAPTTSLTASVDVGADAFTAGAYVSSVTVDFGVPEPASIGVFALGLGMMAMFRRRRS